MNPANQNRSVAKLLKYLTGMINMAHYPTRFVAISKHEVVRFGGGSVSQNGLKFVYHSPPK